MSSSPHADASGNQDAQAPDAQLCARPAGYQAVSEGEPCEQEGATRCSDEGAEPRDAHAGVEGVNPEWDWHYCHRPTLLRCAEVKPNALRWMVVSCVDELAAIWGNRPKEHRVSCMESSRGASCCGVGGFECTPAQEGRVGCKQTCSYCDQNDSTFSVRARDKYGGLCKRCLSQWPHHPCGNLRCQRKDFRPERHDELTGCVNIPGGCEMGPDDKPVCKETCKANGYVKGLCEGKLTAPR